MPWNNLQTISEAELYATDDKQDWKIQIIAHGETLTGDRYYPMTTLQKAVEEGLYDNAKIFINHEFDEQMHRDMHDYAGTILPGSVKFHENGTVEAIAHFHKGEALEILSDDIARKNVGLSQTAYIKYYDSKINGKNMKVIEEIKRIASVDLVPKGNAFGFFLENYSEDQNMDFTKLTLETLQAERPDLVETIQGLVEHTFDAESEEVKTIVETEVQKRLDQINEDIEQAAKQVKAQEMVQGSELPEAAKQKVIESLDCYDEEVVQESIQKEIDYIKALMPVVEEVEEPEIDLGLGQSEAVVEEEDKYEESFISFLKKSGMSSEMIKKLSEVK